MAERVIYELIGTSHSMRCDAWPRNLGGAPRNLSISPTARLQIGQQHGLDVAKLTELDVGVFRVDRHDKQPPVVARLFAASRPQSAAAADLAVLRHLAEREFPAERPHGAQPLSRHEGQPILVTGFVRQAAKAKQPPHSIFRLGARVGRLHAMDIPRRCDRPAGALHHFADGTLSDELRAAAGWLDSIALTGTVRSRPRCGRAARSRAHR